MVFHAVHLIKINKKEKDVDCVSNRTLHERQHHWYPKEPSSADSTHGKNGQILTIVDGQILTIGRKDGQNLTILFGRLAGNRDFFLSIEHHHSH
jgi:hypothetical protein